MGLGKSVTSFLGGDGTMNTKRMLLIVAVAGLLGSSSIALAGVRDAASKVLGDYGDRGQETVYRAEPMYRAAAPMTAQAPTQTRSFSLETRRPAQAATPRPQVAAPTPATAARPSQPQRRYSYEPAQTFA